MSLFWTSFEASHTKLNVSSLAFLPQLLICAAILPLKYAKHNLSGTLFVQTFAFVAFNKVCTSQYFLWYLVLLPLYLARSQWIKKSFKEAILALTAWIFAQVLWLYNAYKLEFYGFNTLLNGLFLADIVFFGVNIWILGQMLADLDAICFS